MSIKNIINIKKLVACSLGMFFGAPLPLIANQACQTDTLRTSTNSEHYKIHNDGTVTDTKTQLVWKTCLAGQKGKLCEKDSATSFSWREALQYVSAFNLKSAHSDWRLPNVRELSSIVELQCTFPAINLSIFPNTPPAHQWTSSPYKFYPHYSWYVDFNDGVYTYGDRTDKNKHVRLVRNVTIKK